MNARTTGLVFLGWAAFSALWSWPLVPRGPGVLSTLHFDVYPTLWVLHHARDLLDLHSSQSGWPLGEDLARPDSFVLIALGAVLPLAPTTLAWLLAWLGPAVNALAAQRLADSYDLPAPSSLLAGLVYGYSGIAGVALLEGHVYHLLDPWLPLAWLAWRRSTTWRGGLLVGAGVGLALLTTAYAGVMALLLVAVLLLVERPPLGVALGAGAVVLPIGLVYAHLFVGGGGWADQGPQPDLFLRQGSQTIAGLLGATGWADAANHSLAAPITWLPLLLLLLAPLRVPKTLPLCLLAILCLVATLGRDIELVPGEVLARIPLPRDVGGAAFFRFPIRLTWLYALVAGVLAGRALATLPRAGAWAILALSALDTLLATNLPARNGGQPAEVPSVYADAPPDRAVLDLFPRPVDGSSGEFEPWARGWGCYYQTVHHRPILEVCLGTGIRSPRELTERWLYRTLGERGILPTLADLGVGAIVVHRGGFRPPDADWLQTQLVSQLGSPVVANDVALFTLPAGDSAHAAEAWARVSAP